MKVWIVYEQSRAKLPVAIFETAQEAAEYAGTPLATVRSIASRARRGDPYSWRFAWVQIEEDEDENQDIYQRPD